MELVPDVDPTALRPRHHDNAADRNVRLEAAGRTTDEDVANAARDRQLEVQHRGRRADRKQSNAHAAPAWRHTAEDLACSGNAFLETRVPLDDREPLRRCELLKRGEGAGLEGREQRRRQRNVQRREPEPLAREIEDRRRRDARLGRIERPAHATGVTRRSTFAPSSGGRPSSAASGGEDRSETLRNRVPGRRPWPWHVLHEPRPRGPR